MTPTLSDNVNNKITITYKKSVEGVLFDGGEPYKNV